MAISGLGGDEIFGGYDSFLKVPRLVGSVGQIPGIKDIGRMLRFLCTPLTELEEGLVKTINYFKDVLKKS